MGKINDLKDQALATLRGKWWSFVGLTFIYMLLYSCVQTVSQIGKLFIESDLIGLAMGLTFVGLVLAIAIMPMEYGFVVAHLHSSRQDQPAEINDLFCGYNRFWHVLGTLILKGLIIAAVAVPCAILMVMMSFVLNTLFHDSVMTIIVMVVLLILMMIPIIIISLMYAMVPYILHDKPNYSCSDVLTESRLMMNGHKEELFWLYLSFAGWFLLGILTLFIGYLWLVPYMQMTVTKFYEERRAEYESVPCEEIPLQENASVEENAPIEEMPAAPEEEAQEPAEVTE